MSFVPWFAIAMLFPDHINLNFTKYIIASFTYKQVQLVN